MHSDTQNTQQTATKRAITSHGPKRALLNRSAFAALFLCCSAMLPESASAQEATPSASAKPQCINTDNIKSYKIETDDLIRFYMNNGKKLTIRLKRKCPQLRFHGYLSYTPTNGRLCTGVDEITTRSGLTCRISSIAPAKKNEANRGSY